jgi:hypothetical protein
MIYSDLYNRISALDKELRATEMALPFGKEPDATIIANLHASVAADIPGLITRAEKKLTPEGRQLTQERLSSFENTSSILLKKFPDMDRSYLDTISKIRKVYTDILSAYGG